MMTQLRLPIVALCLAITGLAAATPARAAQSLDQIAIQLGAIQLGIADISTATAQQQANALVQGQLALAASQSSFNPANFVVGATTPAPQSTTFQQQLYTATEKALSDPLTVEVAGLVTVGGSVKPVKAKGSLDPAGTTASSILDETLKRLPNNGPGLVGQAVAAAVASPQVFGKPGTGLADANKAAGLAMKATLQTYAKGTQQWAGVPPLPNFTDETVNGVPPNLNGLTDAAAAVAANSINGLGAVLKSVPGNVSAMTATLISSALSTQKSSQAIVDGDSPRYGGTVSASSTGIVAQVAGNQQSTWAGPVLQAVVDGAISAAKKEVLAVAYGVSAGFAGTYIGTGGAVASFDKNVVAGDILASFQGTKGVTKKNQASVSAAILAGLNVGLDAANWNDPVNGVAGIGGIKDFTVVNGTGSPLTDTVGL